MKQQLAKQLLERCCWEKALILGLILLLGVVVIGPTKRLKAAPDSRDTHFVYAGDYLNKYPNTKATLHSCLLCHAHDNPDQKDDKGNDIPDDRNGYGKSYEDNKITLPDACKNIKDVANRMQCVLGAIENADSDGDSFTNHEELLSGTFPGNGSNDQKPKISLTIQWFVDSSFSATPIAGEQTRLVFLVKNTNAFLLKKVEVTPPVNACNLVSIQNLVAADFGVVACNVALSADLNNGKATAIGYSQLTQSASISSDPVTVNVLVPQIDVAVTPAEQIAANGSSPQLTINLKNSGEVPLSKVNTTVTVNDLPAAACSRSDWGGRAPGESFPPDTCTLANITTASTIKVEASGEYLPGKTIKKSAVATINVEGVDIEVSTTTTSTVHGEKVIYTTVLTNTSSAVATNATLNNIQVQGPDLAECNPTIPTALASGDHFMFSCPVTALRNSEGTFTNTVTATAIIADRTVTDSDQVTITVEPRAPALNVAMTTSTPRALVGEPAHFTVAIQNTGNVTLSVVSVSTPKVPACNKTLPTLAAQAAHVYDCSAIVTPAFIDQINGELIYGVGAAATAVDAFDGTFVPFVTVRTEINATARLHLPIIAVPGQIDLVVESITLDSRGVEVIIKNRGTGTLAGVGYWVDLYINPSQEPTRVNQVARDWGNDGLVWGLGANAPALAPDGRLTLRVTDSSYVAKLSAYPDTIKAQSKIYVQVDSANQGRDYGAVLEGHEINGDAYNNISMIVVPQDVATNRWHDQPVSVRAADNEWNDLAAQAPRPQPQAADTKGQ